MAREDQLINQIRKGDDSALEELFQMYYRDILRYCCWHTADVQTAEDATQETFIKVFRHLDAYQHRGKFRAFLYKVAANTCRDMWRRRNEDVLSDDMTTNELIYEDKELGAAENEEMLQQMVRSLPEQQQEIVLLRFSQELKVREIAEILGLPLRTVQSRLRAALKRLRQMEAKEGE